MISYDLIELDYSDNLFLQYQKFRYLPGFVLLESTDKTQGRYDILSAYPYKQLKADAENVANFLQEFSTILSRQDFNLDLPFQGGAIGYFSYDLGAKLHGLSFKSQPSLDHMPLAEFGFYDWAIISDHLKKKVFLFSANNQSDTSQIVKEIRVLWDSENTTLFSAKLTHSFRALVHKDEYQASFDVVHQSLREGRAYQVNYTQSFNAAYKGDSFSFYQKVREQNPVPFSAFLSNKSADILSFSPERFLLQDKAYLLSSPIKGTEKRSHNKIEDARLRQHLANSEKNRAENIMIVDLIRNDLGKLAVPGSVRVNRLCVIESYQYVHHLVSHVEAQKRSNLSDLDIFLSCFPGGSITGAPKLEAMKIIAEVENFARGVYCGAIGYFSNHGRFDSNIAIRTITAREGILHLAAGGGIVIDSTWEDEYMECFTKITAIKNALE